MWTKAAVEMNSRRQVIVRPSVMRWIVVVLLLLGLGGCREHPRVTSRESLEFIKQVYTACNTRNPERLKVCRVKLDELVAQSQLSESEQESFRSIIRIAEAGDWDSAQRSSLQFARDQIR